MMKPSTFSVNAAGIPVFQHIEAGPIDMWLDACALIFGLSPINRGDATKDYRVKSWYVEPVSIINSQYHGMVTRHTPWHVEEAGNQVHVHRYARGRASVETAGLPVECEQGAITLLDYSRPFTSVHTFNDCHSFFIPHSAIGYEPSDAFHAPVYNESTTLGRLLGQEMDHLLATLHGGAQALHPNDIARFLGCVSLAMSPQTATEDARQHVRDSLKRSIKLFIEPKLTDSDLCATMILKNFGVSRASLYRMFEPEGGVRNYINRRRLYRAVTHIAENPLRRGQIHQAAELYGFSTDANFNRMVRREFGVAPGALFQMPITQKDIVAPFSDIQTFMTRAARPVPVAA